MLQNIIIFCDINLHSSIFLSTFAAHFNQGVMKRILLLAAIAMCLIGCEKETYMSVAGKTFYEEGAAPAVMFIYIFTTDRVSVCYGDVNNVKAEGSYTQIDDIVTFRLSDGLSDEHAFVKKDMLIWKSRVFTTTYPY